MITWTMPNRTRRIHTVAKDGTFNILEETRKASPRYTPVTPDRVQAKLEAAGFKVNPHFYAMNARSHNTHPGQAILEVHHRIGALLNTAKNESDLHVPGCMIYLDHRGRSSIKLKRGVMRIACENAFYSPDLCIHHCSQEAKDFASNPVPFVREVLNRANSTHYVLEQLRERSGGEALVAFLGTKRKRLSRPVRASFRKYASEHGPSVWSALQATTEPGNRRLDEFAGRLLGDWRFLSSVGYPGDRNSINTYQRMEALWN